MMSLFTPSSESGTTQFKMIGARPLSECCSFTFIADDIVGIYLAAMSTTSKKLFFLITGQSKRKGVVGPCIGSWA